MGFLFAENISSAFVSPVPKASNIAKTKFALMPHSHASDV
ncbi:protein of unknown function [Shinella sp. WSC3-e]|nr:protein of unknown function [Shinella sp. WSC3-e]